LLASCCCSLALAGSRGRSSAENYEVANKPYQLANVRMTFCAFAGVEMTLSFHLCPTQVSYVDVGEGTSPGFRVDIIQPYWVRRDPVAGTGPSRFRKAERIDLYRRPPMPRLEGHLVVLLLTMTPTCL
jgi:hypothetical protein